VCLLWKNVCSGVLPILNCVVYFFEIELYELQFFSEDNFEKLEALSEAYGIPIEGVLNVAVSDQFDSKIASMRDAAG